MGNTLIGEVCGGDDLEEVGEEGGEGEEEEEEVKERELTNCCMCRTRLPRCANN